MRMSIAMSMSRAIVMGTSTGICSPGPAPRGAAKWEMIDVFMGYWR